MLHVVPEMVEYKNPSDFILSSTSTVTSLSLSWYKSEVIFFRVFELNSKTLKNITSDLYQEREREVTVEVLDKIKSLGFLYSTISGTTWSMGDLQVLEEKPGILKEAHKKINSIQDQFDEGLLSVQERRSKIIEIWTEAKRQIEKIVPQKLDPHGSVALIVASGARGSWAQPVQLMGMKGTVV